MRINVYIKGKILLVSTWKQLFWPKYRYMYMYVPRVFTQLTITLHINRCFTSQLSNMEMHCKVTVYVSLLVVWSFSEYACFGKYFNDRMLTSNLVFDKRKYCSFFNVLLHFFLRACLCIYINIYTFYINKHVNYIWIYINLYLIRHLEIHLNNTGLFLIELCLENLALGKLANQSSNYLDSFDAAKAIDGNRQQVMFSYTCAKTGKGHITASWNVDLGKIMSIHHVDIYYSKESDSEYGKQYKTTFIKMYF